VPALVGEACEHGFILVDDLGDRTIAAYLQGAPQRREAVYRRAVRDLANAQRVLTDLPADSIVQQRVFDYDLLRWELDHFREWGLEARGFTLTDELRQRLDASFDSLAHTIASWPRGFVHRDYQSRNLMVVGDAPDERIVWIDFQDALMGPRLYDLVALLNDSYQSFDDAFVSTRLDEYAAALGLTEQGRARVGQEFDRITVQRKLKDAGRFVFIQHKKNDPSFLPFVEPSIDKARRALGRLRGDAEMAELHGLLDECLARA
jgi:aminoglycoside/choline kinase family phosphotransferase